MFSISCGLTAADVSREYAVERGGSRCWKARYGGLTVSEARQMRQLEKENRRPKR